MREQIQVLLNMSGLRKVKPTTEGFAALCPFHDNKNSPSFNINGDTGAWRCWSPNCDERGSLVSFLTRVCNMTEKAAIDYAKQIPTVGKMEVEKWTLPPFDSRHKRAHKEAPSERILALYRHCPRYMLDRGFPKSFLASYEIGFDTEKNRVTFPVRSIKGDLLGFTRRAVDDAWPKYLHDGFKKTEVLYMAHTVMPNCASLLVTEGTVDVLNARYLSTLNPTWSLQDTFANSVGSLGSLTEAQASIIVHKLGPSEIYLAYDNDVAGIAATRKAIQHLRKAGAEQIQVLSFPSSDIGDLAQEQVCDVDFVSSLDWLLKQPKQAAIAAHNRRQERE